MFRKEQKIRGEIRGEKQKLVEAGLENEKKDIQDEVKEERKR